MYIVSSSRDTSQCEITNFMPREIRQSMYGINLGGACEIRMRQGMPLCIRYPDTLRYLSAKGSLTRMPQSALRITRAHIDEALEIATGSSVYSVKEEIKNGFITVSGGHRIGVTGTAVLEGDKISFIKDISGLNYRIAHEVVGAADTVMPLILKDGYIRNTLLVSAPGAGKTTMLRDIARQLSHKGYRVSIVDERCEIAAMHEGKSAFDIGAQTDVLEGVDKALGMVMMLRSMTPEVIITDEIGKSEDVEAVERVINSGAAVIATIHGRDIGMVKRRADLKRMLDFFEVVITLGGIGEVREAAEEW